MHLRTVFLLLLFVLCSVFLVVNWEGVMANVNVNLLYTEIQAPLGLILLLGPGLVILICLVSRPKTIARLFWTVSQPRLG